MLLHPLKDQVPPPLAARGGCHPGPPRRRLPCRGARPRLPDSGRRPPRRPAPVRGLHRGSGQLQHALPARRAVGEAGTEAASVPRHQGEAGGVMRVRRLLVQSPSDEAQWVKVYVRQFEDRWTAIICSDGEAPPPPDQLKGLAFFAGIPLSRRSSRRWTTWGGGWGGTEDRGAP